MNARRRLVGLRGRIIYNSHRDVVMYPREQISAFRFIHAGEVLKLLPQPRLLHGEKGRIVGSRWPGGMIPGDGARRWTQANDIRLG